MPRLILLLAIGAAIYIALLRIRAMPGSRQRHAYVSLALTVTVVAVIGLTLAGKMHWVGAAITGLLVAARQMLPLLIRFLPALGALKAGTGSANATAGQQSTVQTALLRMALDHDSGDLSGEVLSGPFQGRQLEALSREELQQLLAWCREQADSESEQLLSSYLQQRFGDEPGQPPPAASQGNMSRQEALAVLGLTEEADNDAIVAAHRKLMQKLHPDRGGNDYLAAKVNQAKDVLLA